MFIGFDRHANYAVQLNETQSVRIATPLYIKKQARFQSKDSTKIFVLFKGKTIGVAKWSRALAQRYSEWMVPSLNPCECCYGDGEPSLSHIVCFNTQISNSKRGKRRGVRRRRTHWHSKFYFPFTNRKFFEEDSNIKYLSQPHTSNAKERVIVW